MKIVSLLILLFSLVVAKDDGDAYHLGCNTGDRNICFTLGYKISTKEINGTVEEMTGFLEKACKLNSGMACMFLGRMKSSGSNGVKRDPFAGFELTKKAFEIFSSDKKQDINNMSSHTRDMLASKYMSGSGVKQNTEQALALYKEGCDLKDKISCWRMGVYYDEQKNQEKALEYYGKGCDYKHEGSCNLYSLIKKEGPGLK
jgi:TPR repeat protein